MDTSLEYQRMCNTPEIQGQWEPKNGDRFVTPKVGLCMWFGGEKDDSKITWLPTQSQIQEMFDSSRSPALLQLELSQWLSGFCSNYVMNYKDYWPNNCSMEQLWLTFFMFQKHDKVWNDIKKEWVYKVPYTKERNK